jgi:diazepam-binding inhibitor (GABA receptor modulator, acyl-CoA-binding protein)
VPTSVAEVPRPQGATRVLLPAIEAPMPMIDHERVADSKVLAAFFAFFRKGPGHSAKMASCGRVKAMPFGVRAVVPGSRDEGNTMALTDEFTDAQERVRKLKQTPSTDELLELYSLYKQATVGDAQGKRPGLLDFRGRAKYDAWAARAGTSKDAAMREYVELVARFVRRYG